MNNEQIKKVIAIAEELGWTVTIKESESSPGEIDFSFNIHNSYDEDVWLEFTKASVEDAIDYIYDCATEFDLEEYVEMWLEAKRNKVREVPGVIDLVAAGQENQKLYRELAVSLACGQAMVLADCVEPKEIRHILVYQENSDDAPMGLSTRYFHNIDNARKAMLEDFQKRDAILHFPKTDCFHDPENCTDTDENGIVVQMGTNYYIWSIVVGVEAEDTDDTSDADAVDKNVEGVCPECGYDELKYDVADITDDGVEYPWTCPHCGATGVEVFTRQFVCHTDVEPGEGNDEDDDVPEDDSERFERLKQALFDAGHDAVEGFLGCNTNEDDKDVLDTLMDEVYQQMPDDELQVFFKRYGIQ